VIKIAMVVHQCYQRDPRVRRYAEALTEAGVQVDVLCLRDPLKESSGRRGLSLFPIPVVHEADSARGYLLEYATSFTLFATRLMQLYVKNRYQLIHVHNMPDCLVFSALLPKILGARLILDIHDPMPEFYQSKFEMRGKGAAVSVLRWEEKISCKFADAVITANPTFKANLIGRGVPAHKITVVNNFPDSRVFDRARCRAACPDRRDCFTLICPGTIAPRYGLDVVIRALPRLVSHIPQLRLAIIGKRTAHVSELLRLADELGVTPFIEFKSVVPVEEIPAQLAAADVGIYAALSGPHMDIAVPTKILEYGMMGLPIVSSRLKAVEGLFDDSEVMFFDSGDVDQFAGCILELYSNSTRRDDLVQNVDDKLRLAISWGHERRVYLALLNRLLPGEERIPVLESDGM
jgi:glycosyltransferase involved in cell wall biosynthesis